MNKSKNLYPETISETVADRNYFYNLDDNITFFHDLSANRYVETVNTMKTYEDVLYSARGSTNLFNKTAEPEVN